MCGIVGFAGRPGGADPVELLEKMNASQFHRGPDEGGVFADQASSVYLAMRRLSIQDLGGGSQPMSIADESIWIVYNGEVYNAPELREELEDLGCTFKTKSSDTEVILKLYQQMGQDMLSRLNGMFAFVIFDRRKNQLFFARDRLGIKPFYYAWNENRFSFASELKSLLTLPWIDREIDSQALSDYFTFQCIPSPHSIFKSVKKLPPAHCGMIDLNKKSIDIWRYWSVEFQPELKFASENELVSFVREETERAVKRWLLSDVPVAASLSGGIDSSVVVGLVSKINSDLSTYSLGFEDANELDERDLARTVAKRYGVNHHEIVIKSGDLLKDLNSMIYHLDEPYAGGLPSWFVFKAMAKDVKVGLTGSGGDEIFGNYGKWIPYQYHLRRLKRTARHLFEGHSLKDAMKFPVGFYYHIYFREEEKRKRIFSEEFLKNQLVPSEELIEKLWRDCPSPHPRNKVPFIDTQIQLPEEFLHMTDRFSMAHSLEARTPFLDHEFMEKMYRIPAELRTHSDKLKSLMHRAYADLLPQEILKAKKKGFVLPVEKWLRGRLKPSLEAYLDPSYLRRQGIFKDNLFEEIAKPHIEGKKDEQWRLWTLLNFQFWYEKMVIGNDIKVDA